MSNVPPWVTRAAPNDARLVTRWVQVSIEAIHKRDRTLLLRRILGWDDSARPAVTESTRNNVAISVEEVPAATLLDLITSITAKAKSRDGSEVRRVAPAVWDWNRRLSSQTWGLNLPIVAYECWASKKAYVDALEAWDRLSSVGRAVSAIEPEQLGYLGSTVVLVPQLRPYMVGLSDMILPGGRERWPGLQVMSQVIDGDTTLSKTAANVNAQAPRDIGAGHDLIRLHYVGESCAAMNSFEPSGNGDAVAELPRDAHGHSGSDWRLSLVGEGYGDFMEVGLIRGLGGGYFSAEPWRDRAPSFGFSGPARVVYLPPTPDGGKSGVDELLAVGAPASICDPYAEEKSLDALAELLRDGRLLTAKKPIKEGWITKSWAAKHKLKVHVASKLHDRFVIGRRRAFLVGTSVNGLGASHSFLVALDNTMHHRVATVFEERWDESRAAW